MASGRRQLKRSHHEFKGFAKDEVANINKADVKIANNFNLGVDEADIEELLRLFLRN